MIPLKNHYISENGVIAVGNRDKEKDRSMVVTVLSYGT